MSRAGGTKDPNDVVDGNAVYRRNPSGTRLGAVQTKISKAADIAPEELQWMQTRAVMLKAADKSYNYIGDTIRVSTSIVRSWFDDEALGLREQVSALQGDWIKAARDLMEHYALEAVEGLMEIARVPTVDPETARKCYIDVLDRVGLIKVTKSESVVDNRSTEKIDGAEFFERIKGLPIETQTELAELSAKMEELMASAAGEG